MTNKKNILITGCSSGIGLEAAKTLHQRGHHVVATCRNDEDENMLQAHGLSVVQMDMNQSHSIQEGFQKALTLCHGQIDVLINNAGFGQAGALEDITRKDLRDQFETNVFGLMELSALCIPIMRSKNTGRIINVSSVLGLISMPFRGAYNASKYAVEGLSDTLRLELYHSGIKVITVEPGPIESSFRTTSVLKAKQAVNPKASHYKKQYEWMITEFSAQKTNSSFTKSPKAVVNAFIHAIESNKPKIKYKVTFPTYLFAFLKRILPVFALDFILRHVSKKELNQ